MAFDHMRTVAVWPGTDTMHQPDNNQASEDRGERSTPRDQQPGAGTVAGGKVAAIPPAAFPCAYCSAPAMAVLEQVPTCLVHATRGAAA